MIGVLNAAHVTICSIKIAWHSFISHTNCFSLVSTQTHIYINTQQIWVTKKLRKTSIGGHIVIVVFSRFFPKWMFPNIGVPQNGWKIIETPIKMDDLGVPLFLETPKSFTSRWSPETAKRPVRRSWGKQPASGGVEESAVAKKCDSLSRVESVRSIDGLSWRFLYGWSTNTPPGHVPPNNKALWSGLFNHCFRLIRPAIKPLFLGGGYVAGGVGWLAINV